MLDVEILPTFRSKKVFGNLKVSWEERRAWFDEYKVFPFIDQLLKESEVEMNYPPANCGEILKIYQSGFVDETKMMYRNYTVFYCLLDAFITEPNDGSISGPKNYNILTKYCERFKITAEWSNFLISLYNLDLQEVDDNFISQIVGVPNPPFKDSIILKVLELEQNFASKLFTIWNCPEPEYQIEVLLKNGSISDAMMYQRKFDIEKRNNLIPFLYRHMYTEELSNLFSFPLDELEFVHLVDFFKENQKQDYLHRLLILQSKFMEVLDLSKFKSPIEKIQQQRDSMDENVKLIIPSIQKKFIENSLDVNPIIKESLGVHSFKRLNPTSKLDLPIQTFSKSVQSFQKVTEKQKSSLVYKRKLFHRQVPKTVRKELEEMDEEEMDEILNFEGMVDEDLIPPTNPLNGDGNEFNFDEDSEFESSE
jgi:hypothetical protein